MHALAPQVLHYAMHSTNVLIVITALGSITTSYTGTSNLFQEHMRPGSALCKSMTRACEYLMPTVTKLLLLL